MYRRGGEWKFRAVGQGFVGGLGPLAQQYGVDVGDDPDVGAAPAPSPPCCRPPPGPHRRHPRPRRPGKPIRLEKITLEKKGSSISLEKPVTASTNWLST